MNKPKNDGSDIDHAKRNKHDNPAQSIKQHNPRLAARKRNGNSAVPEMPEISGGHTASKSLFWKDDKVANNAADPVQLSGRIGTLYRGDIVSSSYRPHFQAYYYKQWTNYEMAYHQHPSTEIMYMISGSCRIELQIEHPPVYQQKSKPAEKSWIQSESVHLHKGQFIVIDASVPHRLIVPPDSTCRMLNIEFGLVSSDSDSSLLNDMIHEEKELSALLLEPKDYYVLSDPEEVYYTLKSLVLELDQQRPSPMLGDLLFAQLLVRIARLYAETQLSSLPQSESYVRRSIQFMHQNYDRSIRMDQIAAAVNVHPGYLHRIFKKHMQITPTAYLNDLRMDKAMMLLSQTDIPIPEIADYVGIASRQYFHLLFKKHTGSTPADYRNQSDRFVRDYASSDD
ncbi:helix-turn-helix transcriptional regulator [Paenibacillus dauci]|uniref:helix-turn-helix transcriptional regulator n=1 Tax=Paenibacillus dauci TaxID=1567106 RepID=UPI000B31E4C2|nr:helix-turn-helix domain-containing protein [Paenibacillus dauci]